VVPANFATVSDSTWLPAGITRIETANVEGLVELYRHFRQVKFALMAVRHVEVDDPLCGISAFRAVPQVARQRGISLQYPFIRTFFMNEACPYGQVLSLAVVSVRGFQFIEVFRLDRLRTARDLFANGKLPMTVAPEGAPMVTVKLSVPWNGV